MFPACKITQTIKNLVTSKDYPQRHQGPVECQDCPLINSEVTLQPQQDALSKGHQQTHHGQ